MQVESLQNHFLVVFQVESLVDTGLVGLPAHFVDFERQNKARTLVVYLV